jgi:hypothetical protein
MAKLDDHAPNEGAVTIGSQTYTARGFSLAVEPKKARPPLKSKGAGWAPAWKRRLGIAR